MNIIEIITLFATMSALAALPSASVALVITRSMTLGLRNGVAVAVGIVLGDLIFLIFAIQGLSVIAETMGGFFIVTKLVAGLYLIWLGVSLWRSQGSCEVQHSIGRYKSGLLASFMSGLVLTLGDIKAIFFYASLLPMFINLSTLMVSDVVVILATIVLAVGSVKVGYAVFATQAIRFLDRRNLQQVARKTTGGMMIGAGSYLILKS